jgi:toxin FitB
MDIRQLSQAASHQMQRHPHSGIGLAAGIGTADSYIAAIAAAKGLTVATRDTQAFEDAGVTVINPWKTA